MSKPSTCPENPDRYRSTKLDPYRETIEARLSDHTELSAARLFREVREAGYPGGYGQVKRYVRKAKQEILDGPRENPNGQRPG